MSLPGVAAAAPLRGIVFMVLATAFYAASDTLAKVMLADYSVLQVTWARYAFALVLVLLAVPSDRMVQSLPRIRQAWVARMPPFPETSATSAPSTWRSPPSPLSWMAASTTGVIPHM